MVVGSVAQEIHVGVAELLQLVFLRMVLGDVERIGNAETQPLAVEIEAGRGIGDVQAEVAEAPDLERLREQHAADVEFASGALCHDYSLWSGKSFSASAMLATQSRLLWSYCPMRPNFFARSSHTSGAGVMSSAPPASAPMVVDVGLGERGAAHQRAVVLEDHRPLAAQSRGQLVGAFARRVVDLVRIIGDAVVEAHRLLRDRPQAAFLRRYGEVRRGVRVHGGGDVGPRLQHRRVQVVGGGARLVPGLHRQVAVQVVLDEVGRGDLLHENVVGLDEKMIRLAGNAHRDVVVGHVDEHEVRDQAVRRRELAAQPPFLRAYAPAERALGPSDLDDVAFHVRSPFAAGTHYHRAHDPRAPGSCRTCSRNSSSGAPGFRAGLPE